MVQCWGQGIAREQINVRNKILYRRQMEGMERRRIIHLGGLLILFVLCHPDGFHFAVCHAIWV